MLKAIWTGPGCMEVLDDGSGPPPLQNPDDVRLRITATGVCGTDVHIWEGRVPFAKAPMVLGHEFTGVVEACGSQVRNFSPGERVKCDSVVGCGQCESCRRGATQLCPRGSEFGISRDGAWSEWLVVPARNLHRLPDTISDEVAALLDVEVYSGFRKARVEAGETVCVIGAGPAGLIALQCARLMGAGKVILCGRRKERLDLGLRLGAAHAVDIDNGRPTDDVKSLAGGCGADLTFEAAGSEESVAAAIQVTRPQGRVVMYGVPSSTTTPVPLLDAVLKDLTIYCALSDRVGWDELIGHVASGRLDLASLITHRFPLGQAAEALAAMKDRRDGAIKAVLFPPSSLQGALV